MATCIVCGKPTAKGARMCPRCGGNVFSTKPNKFGNHRVETKDGVFDSKLELNRWEQLKLLERAGAIKDLQRQVPFVLVKKSQYGRAINYVADFVYLDPKTDEMVIEDTKSKATQTPLYRLKKRLVAEKYGIVIKEITRDDI